MKLALDNLSTRAARMRWTQVALALGATATVLALSGVPAARWVGLQREIDTLRERVSKSPREVFQGRAYDAVARADALLEVRAGVRELIPANVDHVRAFGLMRLAAESTGVDLENIQPGTVQDLEVGLEDETVERHAFDLQGEGRLDQIVAFLAQVRAAGYPGDVRSCAFARSGHGSERFQFQLDLGLFRRAPAAPGRDGYEDMEFEE